MRRLIIFAAVLAVVSVLFIGMGLGSDAPGFLILPLCLTGPILFMVLGALFSRIALDYRLVPKQGAPHDPRQSRRTARTVAGDGYEQP